MRQHYIQQKGHSTLLLFFAGWGMDEQPFVDFCPVDADFMVCYDYRSLEFDEAVLHRYQSVRLVAWSMGVWAASQLWGGKRDLFTGAVAVNGTPFPIDDERGIPHLIYKGTLEGLNESSLRKFRLRMCGSAEAFNHLMMRAPRRNLEELHEELRCIGESAMRMPSSSFKWDKAVVGTNDRIFAPDNQLRAWEGTEVETCETAHYAEQLWETLLKNKGV